MSPEDSIETEANPELVERMRGDVAGFCDLHRSGFLDDPEYELPFDGYLLDEGDGEEPDGLWESMSQDRENVLATAGQTYGLDLSNPPPESIVSTDTEKGLTLLRTNNSEVHIAVYTFDDTKTKHYAFRYSGFTSDV
ncbi:hypothetical protein ACFL2C_04390 [Patescibacteria group bacterium]